jgi:hypothetical protein
MACGVAEDAAKAVGVRDTSLVGGAGVIDLEGEGDGAGVANGGVAQPVNVMMTKAYAQITRIRFIRNSADNLWKIDVS